MRILHISKYYSPEVGGIETFVNDLVEELSQKTECDVLCTNKKNETVIEKKGNIKIIKAANLKELFSTPISPAMIYWLKKINIDYDLIHIHLPNPMANLACFLVRPEARIIVQWHSDVIRQKKLLFFYEPMQDWMLKKADAIVATSLNYIKGSKYLLKHGDKCHVIPLGLNPKRLISNDGKVREIKNRYRDRPIMFSVGRLIYYKGFEYLIEAMQKIDGCLLIGGEGELKEKLKKLINDLGLQKKVFLIGRVEDKDLGSYYESCDVFCLPSVEKSEAFGMTQLEAMHFGKPIVSTDVSGSGISFVNQNNITGFVIPPRNPYAIAEAINKILKEPVLREKFGKNAKERLEKNFHIRNIAGGILRLYQEIVRLKTFSKYPPFAKLRSHPQQSLDTKKDKKKILFLTYRLPNPEMKDGYAIRVLNIAEILKTNFRVDLVSICRNQEELGYQQGLKRFFGNIILFWKGRISFLEGAVKGLFNRNSIQEDVYYLKSMQRWIEDHYKEYDVIFCNTLRTAKYVENLKTIKVIDLIESLKLKYSSAKKYVNFLWKIVYDIEIPRLSEREQKIVKSFNKVFISSEFDKRYLCQDPKVVVIPNGVKGKLLIEDRNRRTEKRKEENWISFFGKMDYQPNADAVVWFAENVLPLVKKERLETVFYVIGTNPTKKVKRLEKIGGIRITGFLDDPYEIIKKSKIVVAPLRFGSGVQNKILEAMALGKVVLTSKIGERGIEGAKTGSHFEVINSFDACLWAKKIIELLSNSSKREEIGKQAQRLIRENYRWEKVGEKLLKEIKN